MKVVHFFDAGFVSDGNTRQAEGIVCKSSRVLSERHVFMVQLCRSAQTWSSKGFGCRFHLKNLMHNWRPYDV